MTFEQFWEETYKGGLTPAAMPAAKALAEAAWSAAVCSAQAACFDQGEMRTAGMICAELSKLHSWNQGPTTETLS